MWATVFSTVQSLLISSTNWLMLWLTCFIMNIDNILTAGILTIRRIFIFGPLWGEIIGTGRAKEMPGGREIDFHMSFAHMWYMCTMIENLTGHAKKLCYWFLSGPFPSAGPHGSCFPCLLYPLKLVEWPTFRGITGTELAYAGFFFQCHILKPLWTTSNESLLGALTLNCHFHI